MTLCKHLVSSTAALLLCAGSFTLTGYAQQSPTQMASVQTNAQVFPLQQILPLTVHQAWLTSGKDEATFFDIVTQLAICSAKNRDLQLPQTQAAGQQVGDMIKTMAAQDTDQLLFAVVDAAVRKVGTPLSTPAAQ